MKPAPCDENWEVLLELFPPEWRDQAHKLGAVQRLRGFETVDALMRVLLIHIAQGYSLREAVVQAKGGRTG